MVKKRPRSEDTKERIVQAARRLFSEEGYERTTIRAVAAEAKIDPSMVMRYFVTKEGLFAAATSFDLRLPKIAELPRREVGTTVVRHFFARWQGKEDDELVVLLRAASSNEEAREQMRAIFREQVLPLVNQVVTNKHEAPLRAELVGAQILGLAFCRFVLRLPNLTGEDVEQVIERVGRVIDLHLFD